MTLEQVADTAAAVCLLVGAALSFIGAVGLLRFPDLLSRMHAATKPQVLGVLLSLLGLGLRLRLGIEVGLLLLIALFQVMTMPVAAHMVSRAAVRLGQIDEELLTENALGKGTPAISSQKTPPER